MSITFDNKTRGITRTIRYPAKVPFAFTSSTGMDSNQIYTSEWNEAVDYNTARGVVYISGSQRGETIGGSFEIQQSYGTSSVAELTSSTYAVQNGIGKPFEETLYARYVRLEYTNNVASGSALYTGSFAVQGFLIA